LLKNSAAKLSIADFFCSSSSSENELEELESLSSLLKKSESFKRCFLSGDGALSSFLFSSDYESEFEAS